MVFSSIIFLFCFLPAVLLIYYIVPFRAKNITLLIFSLLFYWWNKPSYVFLILLSISINYLGGLLLNRIVKEKIRRAALICILAANIILLVIFKYTDFIITTVNQITHGNIALTGIILPAGISFYTFQGMSYIIDIYRNTCACCKKPLDTALYISLFPQLVAGPIVKYNEIYHQINHRHTTISDFSYGIIRFIIGLSKKVLIANVLGETADAIFSSNPSGIDTPTA